MKFFSPPELILYCYFISLVVCAEPSLKTQFYGLIRDEFNEGLSSMEDNEKSFNGSAQRIVEEVLPTAVSKCQQIRRDFIVKHGLLQLKKLAKEFTGDFECTDLSSSDFIDCHSFSRREKDTNARRFAYRKCMYDKGEENYLKALKRVADIERARDVLERNL